MRLAPWSKPAVPGLCRAWETGNSSCLRSPSYGASAWRKQAGGQGMSFIPPPKKHFPKSCQPQAEVTRQAKKSLQQQRRLFGPLWLPPN